MERSDARFSEGQMAFKSALAHTITDFAMLPMSDLLDVMAFSAGYLGVEATKSKEYRSAAEAHGALVMGLADGALHAARDAMEGRGDG